MLLMISPKNLGIGVINSQIIEKAIELSNYQEVTVAVCSTNVSQVKKHEAITILSYNSYSDIISQIKNSRLIYTREIWDFMNIYIIKLIFRLPFNIFYSYRALIYEESFFKNKSLCKRKVLFLIEQFIYRKADHVGVVTEVMKNKLVEVFKKERKVFIQPCCTTAVKFCSKRSKEDSVSFVYVGSLSKWQLFDETLLLYKSITSTFKIKTEFTIITNQVDLAKEKCHKVFSSETMPTILSLPQQEVAAYLEDFDFGFLIRDNIPVNNVASPIKLLEYTSNGVIPILTNGIGDYSKLVKHEKTGIVLNDVYDELEESQTLELLRDKEIHSRLFKFSSRYTWKRLFETSDSDPLVNKAL